MPRFPALLLTLLLIPACMAFPAAAAFPSPATSTPPPQTEPAASPVSPAPAGRITFAINVHDWYHADESAVTLLRLLELFEKYHVRGDFYFTPEVTREYAAHDPEVIERFQQSEMTISYHLRAPHPLYSGFDSRLKGLSGDELYQTILDYETYALDLETGDLDRSRPGGYTYVAHVFGRNPVVASAPNNDPRIQEAAQKVYASLGAQMTVLYHEEGTKIERPFEYTNGLLIRPSDFSITRTTAIDGKDNFWWNFMSKPTAARYNPTIMLQTQLAAWEAHQYGRAPLITVLIHENNFYRSGPESWTGMFYKIEKGQRGDPLSPPFDLNAPDPSKLRTEADREAIFAAYEELIAYAAAHLEVVTSADLVKMAR